jgi:hypothetical protein
VKIQLVTREMGRGEGGQREIPIQRGYVDDAYGTTQERSEGNNEREGRNEVSTSRRSRAHEGFRKGIFPRFSREQYRKTVGFIMYQSCKQALSLKSFKSWIKDTRNRMKRKYNKEGGTRRN